MSCRSALPTIRGGGSDRPNAAFQVAAICALLFVANGGVAPPAHSATPSPASSAAAIPPQGEVPQGETRCRFTGWLSPKAGRVPLYGAPSESSAVVANLPVVGEDFGYGPGIATAVDVIASREGWLRVGNARYEPEVPEGAPPIPATEGWLRGDRVIVKILAHRGRAQPSLQAPVVAELGDSFEFSTRLDRIVACQDNWVLVDFTLPERPDAGAAAQERETRGEQRRAWFTDLCEIIETSCDMPVLDGRELPENE